MTREENAVDQAVMQGQLFRDLADEKRHARRLKGTMELVRTAYGDADSPDFREIEQEVFHWGLALRADALHGGHVVTHVGTGYRIGPRFDVALRAREFAYLLRHLPWGRITVRNSRHALDRGALVEALAEVRGITPAEAREQLVEAQ